MKLAASLLALVLFPTLAAADALATGVFVLDRPTFDKLVKEAGAPRDIPTEALIRSSVHTGFTKDSYAGELRFRDQRYQVLAHCAKDGSAIYSIAQLAQTAEGPRQQLICVGAVGSGAGAKAELGEDPLIVVFRTGDFLKQ